MSILRRRALIAEDSIPYWYDIDEDWDYIIDQTGNYDNPIIVNKKNLYGDKLSSIASIRGLSKLVVGYYDESSAKLIWEPLDNSSKTIVKHPTSAYPINIKVSDYMTEHPTADVFMKLPEFWWRCWNIDDNVDTVAFKFVTEEPTDDNNWFHWDGNIFIGVYKGYVNEADTVKLLRSISGVNPTGRYSWENIKLFARNKGANYSLITYEVHCIMALLGYGFYGTTDVKFDWIDAKDPVLNPDYGKITGIRDGDGMTDTFENNSYVNYWGLEGWFGGQQEYIDNMKATGYGEAAILDKNSNILRRIAHTANPSYYSVGISKMVLGYYADLLPTKFQKGSYYGHGHGAEYADSPAVRGSYLSGSSLGWSSVVGSISDIDLIGGNTSETSRLQYEGSNEQYNGLNPPAITISSYTIDQTGPSNTDSKNMITFNTDNKVILDIRANSDFYALENKDWGTDTPEFIKMSKTDKLKTTRGTTLDANNYDIFMKLPEFWWKCENVENNEDKVKFSFTMINPNNNTWHHWDGKTFIGVYKSYYKNGKIYSRSGVTLTTPSPNITINTLKQSARNRGNGFQLITYEAHQMIALLEFGYLASVSKYGFYDYNNNYAPTETTGALDSYGFSTKYTHSIADGRSWFNFWGLENWLSTVGDDEVLDNLVTNKRDGKVCADILDYDGNVIRSVYCDSVLKLSSYALPAVTKLVLGEYGDILPKSGISGANGIRCYDAYTRIHNNSTGYVFKKGCENFVAFVAETYDTPDSYNSKSRLLYKGNYTIGEEFQV